MYENLSRCWLIAAALILASCGGGGGSEAPATPPTLVSISLSPATVTLPAGGTKQLQVIGAYSNGTTAALTTGETFASSAPTTAAVSATGLVTVATTAAIGAAATISATDTASGLTTSGSAAALITVGAASAGAPTPTSAAAATSTAQNSTLCTTIEPFYWEIGDASGTLVSGSVGVDSTSNAPVTATTNQEIASASKWLYGMYVIQKRGGAANLTPQDITFLQFTSGYTYMGSDTQSTTCKAPTDGSPDSINACLTLTDSSGNPFNAQNPATIGVFDYDSGHEENHAGQFQQEIAALDTSDLGPAIAQELGVPSGGRLVYEQPLLAGGIVSNAATYAGILRSVLSGQLGMLDALGTNAVCAWTGGTDCPAAYSPIFTTHWHYSIAHWVEDDPATGDGAFSSPGAFGFYPWIEANKTYYGVISRFSPTGNGGQNGYASAQCGALIRHAWDKGVAQ